MPVSYTHLDVYKRQHVGKMFGIALQVELLQDFQPGFLPKGAPECGIVHQSADGVGQSLRVAGRHQQAIGFMGDDFRNPINPGLSLIHI